MNIFSTEQGFIGEDDFVASHNVFQEFLVQARSIRSKLGKKAYRLDEYIRHLLLACTYPIEEVFVTDPGNVTTPISAACKAITSTQEGRDSITLRTDSGKTCLAAVKDGTQKLPGEYQDVFTRRRVYYGQFVDRLLESCMDRVVYEIWNEFESSVDSIAVIGLFKEICELLGSEADMERLNDLFATLSGGSPAAHCLSIFRKRPCKH